MSRESMEFDVVIVGAGPAGLATSIRLAQLAAAHQTSLSICIIDKGDAIGAHILSGAVLEPRALNELLPDWQNQNPPYAMRLLFSSKEYIEECVLKRWNSS